MFLEMILVAGGIGFACGVRRIAIRHDVKARIKRQNMQIVEEWRESDTEEQYLSISREVKPEGLFQPRVHYKKTYRRHPGLWEQMFG